jgi:hypothetical protein
MRVATYNLRKGGSGRVHWARMVEDHAVDLLLVQESYPPDEHLPPLLHPDARSQAVWQMVGRNGWGSAVYVRSGLVTPVAVPGFAGWVVGAEVREAAWLAGPGDPPLAFSVHAPSRDKSYAAEVNRLLDEIGRVACGRELVIGGDFNLTVSHWCGAERPVPKCDLAIQARLADEFGLVNCWQAANPDRPLAQTLRWTSNPATPYHCDGLFVPRTWAPRLVSCEVLAGEDWNALSDHNPVVACFA